MNMRDFETMSAEGRARRGAMRGELLDRVSAVGRARKRRGRAAVGAALVVLVGCVGVWVAQRAPTAAPIPAPPPIAGPTPGAPMPAHEPASPLGRVAVATAEGAADPYRVEPSHAGAGRWIVRTDASIAERLRSDVPAVARASDDEALAALSGTGVGLVSVDGRLALSAPLPRAGGF